MSVFDAFAEVNLMQLNYSTELGRPLGQYELVGVTIGDATGGTQELSHVFPPKYFWSCEGWNATETLGGPVSDFSLIWTPNSVLGVAWRTAGSSVIDLLVRALVSRDSRPMLPLTNPDVSQGAARVAVSVENNNNLEIFRANVWGYYWDRRATRVPGGLVRP